MPVRLPASAASCGTHPLPPCCCRRPLQIAALVPEDVRAAFIPLYKCCYDRYMQLKSDEEQGVAAPACADGKGKEQVGCSWVAAVAGQAAAGTVAEHCQLEHIDGQQGGGTLWPPASPGAGTHSSHHRASPPHQQIHHDFYLTAESLPRVFIPE